MNSFQKPLKKTLFVLIGIGLMAMTFSVWAGDIVTYVQTDTLGNPVTETNSAGVVIWRQSYTPYGQTYLHADPAGPGFTGHRNDPATGLVYMQARYYDPEIGRFLSVDPVEFSPDRPRYFNRYWYAGGNPYKYTDPDGRCGFGDCLIPALVVACVDGGCEAAATFAEDAYQSGELPVLLDTTGTQLALAVAVVSTGPQLAETHNDSSDSQDGKSESSISGLPKGLVGQKDSKSRQQGDRVNSGPLAPEHGGTGDAEKDFGKLTDGKSGPAPADKRYPEGTRVGKNGISIRPATDSKGPRIDIPANGDKPSETLHYPKQPQS